MRTSFGRPTFLALSLVILSACSSSAEGDNPLGADDGDENTAALGTESPSSGSETSGSGPEAKTRKATPLGTTGLSVNGAVQPHGAAGTYWFEYGSTTRYGKKTTRSDIAPRLAAHYRESWDKGFAGWLGGLGGTALRLRKQGCPETNCVRYPLPGDIDTNHIDGIGENELVQYMYIGGYETGTQRSAWLAGGDPDLRGAKISAKVRGNRWRSNGSEMVFWMQTTPNVANQYDPVESRLSNWALTSVDFTDALLAGTWQQIDYTLVADTNAWTYAGNWLDTGRATYIYQPLDEVLGHLNADIFHMLVSINPTNEPRGSIDIDDFELTYRNESLVFPSNGGHIYASPEGADDPSTLTDGWRNGEGHTWKSAESPSKPQDIVYVLDNPVSVDAVQIHQNPEWPAKKIEVSTSTDGRVWSLVTQAKLPRTHKQGPNFAFVLDNSAHRDFLAASDLPSTPWPEPTGVRFVRVRILSGYRAEHWGLGEIEIFGRGATMQTDDDWVDVTADITGQKPGATIHYRVVTETTDGVAYGPDVTYKIPSKAVPVVETGAMIRMERGLVKLGGRIDPMGLSTIFHFEVGETKEYGLVSLGDYAGLQITPRTATAEVADVESGKTYHYRLVATNEAGTTYGADATFVAP